MNRKFWIGASFSALVIAALAPWSVSQASGVSVRVSTPEFGIRIGAPHRPPPIYYPVPVHEPRYYGYAPPPVVYIPPPRYIAPPVYGYPYHYAGGRGYGHYRQQWRHPHWRHDRRHDAENWRHDRRHDDDRLRGYR
jgi:hypothetical protein